MKFRRALERRSGCHLIISGGRLTRPNQELTQHFAKVLEDNGLIEERTDHQIYSVEDQRFLPDRYVEGICPTCDYEKARGDQCDNCGRLLDPTDLKETVFSDIRLQEC